MDDTNRRPPTPPGGVGDGGAEAALEGADWRAQLPPELREGIVDNIMDTLKTHLPVSGPEDLQELKKIAMRFEEKIYTAATSQSDYLGKISPKMLTMETKSQSTLPNALPSNSAGSSSKDSDMLSQIQSQSQPIPNSLAVNQPQAHQQLLVQNVQNNVQSGGQAAASLLSTLPFVSGLKQSSLPSTIGQNNNMQNMASFSQNLLANSMGQGLNSNMFVNSERVIQAMQRMASQKQQQQSQNPQQYLYQQQLTKQKLQPGNILHSLVSSRFQQQPQQQNLLLPTKLQAPQQSVLQTSSVMQSHSMQLTPLTGLQQNQQSSVPQSTQSMLQQHQGLWQQQPQQAVRQQQASLLQQPMLTPQQHQQHQLSSQQLMQQNQLVGQQNNLGDKQQQQRLLNQQNNLQNLQQQQLLMLQQNNLTNIHPQQMAPQINVSGLNQHRPLVASQSGNFSMQAGQHPVYGLQQSKVPLQQQIQGGTSNLLASQGQQSQAQPMQQQLMSQIQQQPAQLQQQVGLQQQANILQRVMHQRLQPSGSLVQQQNVIDQLKQLCPSHRSLPETSTTSIDSSAQAGHSTEGDWQEEAYQKIKSMKEVYLSELNEMHQKISMKLQQAQESSYAARETSPSSYALNAAAATSNYSSAVHENQMNPQLQSMNLQGSVASMQQNNMGKLNHYSMSLSGVSNAQQTMINSLQPNSNMDSVTVNALSTMQVVGMGSMQQSPVDPQQVNMSTMQQQGGVHMLQSNVNKHQSDSSMLQYQHLKQQQEQEMLPTQQLKQQYKPRQMQQQLKQQLLRQQLQQDKQQLPSQLQTHQRRSNIQLRNAAWALLLLLVVIYYIKVFLLS